MVWLEKMEAMVTTVRLCKGTSTSMAIHSDASSGWRRGVVVVW